MSKRKLLLFIGDSGSGKTTQAERIVQRYPDDFDILVSTTTREMRDGEVEGKDYYYISVDEFKNRDMIEEVEFPPQSNKFYGVQSSEFDRVHKNMILVIEPNGAIQIKKYIEEKNLDIETLIVYFDIPKNFIRKTLLSKGIDSEEVEKRLSRGNIPEDFRKFNLRADLTIKKLNDKTVDSIVEWISYINEIYS